MSYRSRLRRRERRRKHIIIAACSVLAAAVVVVAGIFIIKAVKKTPDKEGDAKPVASVLTSADELMQSGDFDGALALLAFMTLAVGGVKIAVPFILMML